PRLLGPDVVLHRLHALDAPRDLAGPARFRGSTFAGELDHALRRSDADVERAHILVLDESRLHLRGDHAVIHVGAGALTRLLAAFARAARATDYCPQRQLSGAAPPIFASHDYFLSG